MAGEEEEKKCHKVNHYEKKDRESNTLSGTESSSQEIMRSNYKKKQNVKLRNLELSQRVAGKLLNILEGKKLQSESIFGFNFFSFLYFAENEVSSHSLN